MVVVGGVVTTTRVPGVSSLKVMMEVVGGSRFQLPLNLPIPVP